VEVTVNDNNKLIDIGCVHLSYSDHFEVTNHRKREVDNLVSIVANKKKKYLLCGDFNSEPDSYTIKKLSKYLINAGPDYSENSWTTKPFEYHGFVENSLNWRLDYVFSTKDVNVISAKIIKTKYSDHLPLMVEI
jgi:endonuclease/exonuclease/phosphatase family metal-dependent hydrolase